MGAIVAALDLWLLREGWLYPTVLTALYVATFVCATLTNRRLPNLVAVCENGLLVESRGVIDWVDWRELNSVVHFETLAGSQYDVNAKGVGYRLKQRDIGEARLQDIIGVIIHRARFEWINATMATRPEILERYRPTRIQTPD